VDECKPLPGVEEVEKLDGAHQAVAAQVEIESRTLKAVHHNSVSSTHFRRFHRGFDRVDLHRPRAYQVQDRPDVWRVGGAEARLPGAYTRPLFIQLNLNRF